MFKFTPFAAALIVALGLLFMPASPPAQAYDPASYIGSNNPPADFCSVATCIANFSAGAGYVVRCVDGEYSKSGGIQGACSGHGGVGQSTAPSTSTLTPTVTATLVLTATSTATPVASATLIATTVAKTATAIPTSTRPATLTAPVLATPLTQAILPSAVSPPRTGDGGLR